MRKAVKKKWLEALRSGEYKQGKRTLRRIEADGGYSYCCLGVLCDLAVKEGVIEPPKVAGTRTEYGNFEANLSEWGSTGALPSKVVEWAFTKKEVKRHGKVELTDPRPGNVYLSAWNDQRDADFPTIADLIEEHL